jgi:hypothetical protein
MHAVLVHGSGAGQSDDVSHGGTHAPWPSQTAAPPSAPQGVPAGTAAVSQQPAAHVATRQGEDGDVQSLGWLQAAQLPTVSPPAP